MSNAKHKAVNKITQNLFLPDEETKHILTPNEQQRKKRLMLCITKKLEDPLISDKDLIEQLTTGLGGIVEAVSQSTAYRDIAVINNIVGNIQLASKSWYRYMIIEGAKEAFSIAKEQRDAKGMAAALDKIGKYTKADKDDNENDWSQLIPPSFEPTDDISILGDEYTPIDKTKLELRRKELRSHFNIHKNIEEAQIIPDNE